MKSYKDLEIYQISFELFINVHLFSLRLPKHELYELGSQLRRSSDSVNTNIVEGYGRRAYKNDFIKFLIYSQASCLESICHLEKLGKIYPKFETQTKVLIKDYEVLGSKLFRFIDYVRNNWRT